MRKLRLIITIFVLLMPFVYLTNIRASAYNYATNTHNDDFYYVGYVQCVPAYHENTNKHAMQAWIRYYIPLSSTNTNESNADPNYDTGRQCTDLGTGQLDSNVYSKLIVFYDDPLNWFGPKTQFRYGFRWVLHNDNYEDIILRNVEVTE